MDDLRHLISHIDREAPEAIPLGLAMVKLRQTEWWLDVPDTADGLAHGCVIRGGESVEIDECAGEIAEWAGDD